MNAAPIVVEQTFSVPKELVWKAITDKDQMRQWFFETMTDFKPQVGFETQFNVRCEDRDFLHLWKVTDVHPGKSLAYDWRYAGYPGDSTVTWEVSETPNGTQLKLTHRGNETFSQEDAVLNRESCQAGWEYFLQDRLKAFLERQSA